MYDLIPLVLILISLTVMAVIFVRKFPALANLDVENIPAEKEARFKQQIVSNRLKRSLMKWNSKAVRFIRPALGALGNFFKWSYAKLIELKESYKGEKLISPDDLDKRIAQLLAGAEELERDDNLAAAEKKLIEVIGLDSKNIQAFKKLAHIYFDRKDYEEAKQTFEHILKLKEDDEEAYEGLGQIAQEGGNLDVAREDYLKSIQLNSEKGETYYKLALVLEASKNPEEAVENMKKALKIEPNNPRYLDTMLRISIIIKDKISALDAYDRFKKANPENQKLAEFKSQIDLL